MIRKFLEHISYLSDELDNPNTILEVVCLPSGVYFEITQQEYAGINDSFITWSEKLGCYTCRDKDYDSIIKQIGRDPEPFSNEMFIVSKLKELDIENYKIDNEKVEVFGDVIIKYVNFKTLPIKFSRIRGNFTIAHCGLLTLENCPTTVDKNFDCSYNKLSNLIGGPRSVGGKYDCSHNDLLNLDGSPVDSNDSFDCSYNKLITLDGCSTHVYGDFNCSHNEVKDLIHSPVSVDGVFNCSYNNLKSLDFAPSDYSAIISDHNNLKSSITNSWKDIRTTNHPDLKLNDEVAYYSESVTNIYYKKIARCFKDSERLDNPIKDIGFVGKFTHRVFIEDKNKDRYLYFNDVEQAWYDDKNVANKDKN